MGPSGTRASGRIGQPGLGVRGGGWRLRQGLPNQAVRGDFCWEWGDFCWEWGNFCSGSWWEGMLAAAALSHREELLSKGGERDAASIPVSHSFSHSTQVLLGCPATTHCSRLRPDSAQVPPSSAPRLSPPLELPFLPQAGGQHPAETSPGSAGCLDCPSLGARGWHKAPQGCPEPGAAQGEQASGRRSRVRRSRWCYFSIFALNGFGIFLSLFAALVVFFSSLSLSFFFFSFSKNT